MKCECLRPRAAETAERSPDRADDDGIPGTTRTRERRGPFARPNGLESFLAAIPRVFAPRIESPVTGDGGP
jgi:hypothetical protein